MGDRMNYDRIQYQTYLLRHERNQNKGKSGNDTEKTKTYKAEWKFQAKVDILEFDNISEAQKFANKVCKSKTWAKLCAENSIGNTKIVSVMSKQKNTGRGTAGWAQGNKIILDQICGLDVYTLLHEMAHCAGNWHHGRSFRKDLLKLVSRFMSRHHADMLKAEFKASKLKCGEARKPLSFDKWKAARARVEHAQASL
jgi:hypothetical protein